ncbi:competence type IV pilus minor pilin ComGF [Chryseomicrobium palamuruense]|uniref:Competence type IV pilus minor pilin ComGF n=1 Tax=Chryseomicrobium palamuruense TaxID=682973 RepID=A0ABV8UXW2_9BACL
MQRLKLLNQRGYFLLDLYLQLLLLVITSVGIAFFLGVLHPVKKQLDATIPLEYELFWMELESTAAQSTTVDGGIHSCILRLVTNDGTYIYEKYGTIIRKRKNNLGHEPVLQQVQSCEIQGSSDQIRMTVYFLTGEVIERVMYIAPSK